MPASDLPPLADDGALGHGAAVVARELRMSAHEAPSARAISHSFAALAYFTEGQARVSLHGEVRVRAGEVLVVPPGVPHRLLETHGARAWGVQFCAPCVRAEGGAALLEPLDRVRAGAAPVVSIAEARRPFLEALLGQLAGGAAPLAGDASWRHAVEHSLLVLVLAELAAAMASTPPAPHNSLLADTLRFIERHCLRPLTVAEVARAVGRSPSYLTSALRAATGRNVSQWIVSGRMAEARRLLSHSDERIDVIGERVGYADPTHFIRMFRRTHGLTPAAWRQRGGHLLAP